MSSASAVTISDEVEARTLENHCRSLMNKIYNRGHSGLDQDCPLCQAYIAADRLLSFETDEPLSDEVRSWDAALRSAPAPGEPAAPSKVVEMDRIEAAARALCAVKGINPDGKPFYFGWRNQIKYAEAVAAALGEAP